MRLIKFVLTVVFLVIGFYTEAIAYESDAQSRISERNFQRELGRTESEYRAAEQGYNSTKEQLDKIDAEIEGLNKIIGDSQRIIDQIEMRVFNCSSSDFRDFREKNDDGSFGEIECVSYVRNRERKRIQDAKNTINELENGNFLKKGRKQLQDELSGAKANLDEKKDNYTVTQENYDAFRQQQEEMKKRMDEHNTAMQVLEGDKKAVIQSNEQVIRNNSGFLNEKPQYRSPRTWKPRE
jgi:chromosome segregation ATPase